MDKRGWRKLGLALGVAAATHFAGAAQPADAEVISKAINWIVSGPMPDPYSGLYDRYSLDVDDDGSPEIQFINSSFGLGGAASLAYMMQEDGVDAGLSLYGYPPSAGIDRQDLALFMPYPAVTNEYGFPTDVVGPDSTWEVIIDRFSGPWPVGVAWRDSYLHFAVFEDPLAADNASNWAKKGRGGFGFRFDDADGNLHYGYVILSVAGMDLTEEDFENGLFFFYMTIESVFWESEPDTPITIDLNALVPEPSAIGLLSLSSMLALSRRRRG